VSPRRARVAVLAFAVLGLVACGKKGPPVAPELRLPTAPAAPAAFIDEGSILVTWTNPGTRLDGTSLKDLVELKLHRRHDTDGTPLKPAMLSAGRVVGYDEIATIRLDAPAPATVQGNTVRWIDRDRLVLGERYVYVVTAIDSLGRSSPPSERRPITFLPAPKPPADVQASAGNGQVTLSWRAASEFTDGSPVTGEVRYLVLRGAGGEGPLSMITAQPIAETRYTDAGLDNDAEYRYAVRAVRLDPRATAAGPASPVVAATPRVTTPPRPPGNLVAVPSPGALRLAWNASPEPNVALYAVYRAIGTAPFTRIASALAGTTTYIDRDVRSGTAYRYAVTAIDNARQPNESARSNEVTVTAP
jgi:hypothetical protein